MHRLFRTLSNAMGFAAIVLAAGCAEPITSPSDPRPISFSMLQGGPSIGELSAGGYHTCVLKTDGSIVCWGRNSSGQATPPSGLVAVQVSAGQTHTCALKADGTVACWGDNSWGELNVPAGLVATQVGAGTYDTCAVRTDATAVCWGAKNVGLSTVPDGLSSVAKIFPAPEHTCALKTDGTVVCWDNVQVINDQTNVPAGLDAVQVSGRWIHVCALQADGTVACWGYPPFAALPAGIVATQVSAGGNHTCALLMDATVSCWGWNDYGQTNVPPALASVAQVSSGYLHTCALKTDGTVVCWGLNLNGQTDVPGGLNSITTQPQAISFTSTPPVSPIVGGSYVVTASGGGSGNPVTFTTLTSATCRVTGSTVDFVGSGTCTIAADQLGNPNYFPAPQATQSMTVVEVNVAPAVSGITLPASPVPIATTVVVAANFTDGNLHDSHTATVSWDDGATTAGTVSEASGAGTVSATHAYAGSGVYTLGVSVSDGSLPGTRSSELDVPAYIVAYDPAAGFVTGGGWINSPIGACRWTGCSADGSTIGKATFGFVSRYQKGANVPTGNTEFQFKAAGLSFSSTSYQWLVVAGSKAQYKGEGTINGSGSYDFLLTAIDGDLPGGGGADRFRIKIWDKVSGGVIYDNKIGSLEDSSDTTALGGGSIVIHK